MRRGARFALVSSLRLLVAAPACSAELLDATWFQVVQGFPMTRTSAQLGASGIAYGGDSVALHLTYPQYAVSFFVPKSTASPITRHVRITQGGSQNVTVTPSMARVRRGAFRAASP